MSSGLKRLVLLQHVPGRRRHPPARESEQGWHTLKCGRGGSKVRVGSALSSMDKSARSPALPATVSFCLTHMEPETATKATTIVSAPTMTAPTSATTSPASHPPRSADRPPPPVAARRPPAYSRSIPTRPQPPAVQRRSPTPPPSSAEARLKLHSACHDFRTPPPPARSPARHVRWCRPTHHGSNWNLEHRLLSFNVPVRQSPSLYCPSATSWVKTYAQTRHKCDACSTTRGLRKEGCERLKAGRC